MSNPIPSMNAMVDSITDAVESAIHRGHHVGGLRRFMLQGAIRRALRDISDHRIPPHHFHDIHIGGSSGHRSSPCPELALLFAPGVCPTHGPTMFVRHVGASPLPSTSLRPPTMLLPPPPPLPSTTLALSWNGGGGSMAAHCGAPPLPNHSAGAEAWLPGFTYDLNIALPPAPPPTHLLSYADVAANRRQGLHRNVLPLGNTLRARFVSSSDEEGAVPHLGAA
jgi:hypothetical protein